MANSLQTAVFLLIIVVTESIGSTSFSSNNSSYNDPQINHRNGDTVALLSDIAATLRLDRSAVTVSGLSSGGYMAVQMHIAFSSLVNGAAVFAGGPFYCADSNAVTAQRQCMAVEGSGPNVAELLRFTGRKESLGQVDALANLQDDRVFLFHGSGDTVVNSKVVSALQEYYASYVPASGITTDLAVPAEHCMPTISYGEACLELVSPYIGRCEVDGAGRALTALLGPQLQAPATAVTPARLMAFDQTRYYSGGRTSLDSAGFVYVPARCQDGETSCRLHVSFHGCLQGRSFVGDQYALQAGFNQWADTNNLVVLYPNAVADEALGNPNGCWDWWGYTNVNYGLKDGVQMVFARSLVDALIGA